MARGPLQTLRSALFNIFWLFAIWITLAWGYDERGRPKWMVDNPPQEYIVREGDTLWDIACKYLHDPWHWPQLWEANPEIQNPNLIYPGDKIVLIYLNGQPRMSLHKRVHANVYHQGVVKLHPRIRVLPADRAIPTIPLTVIGPFLNESRVVTSTQADRCPQVIALDEDHILVGTGDRLYVKGLAMNPEDQYFTVFRPTQTYLDPRTKTPIGIEGLVLGKVQLEIPGHTARLIITKSFYEIKVNDRLMNTSEEELDPYFIPKYPKGPAKGQIISVFGGINQIGQYQVLVITGGKNEYREVGDVLDIFQTQKDLPSRLIANSHAPYRFPPFNIGRCVVFRVFDKVSYVLVMKAIRPIYLLDQVGRP